MPNSRLVPSNSLSPPLLEFSLLFIYFFNNFQLESWGQLFLAIPSACLISKAL